MFFNKKSEPSSLCFATGNILVQMEFIITGHYPEVAIMVFGVMVFSPCLYFRKVSR